MCWPWRHCSLSTSLPRSSALGPALPGQGAVGQGVPRPHALISGQGLQRMRSDIGAQTWGGCHPPGVQLPGPHVVPRGASFPRVGGVLGRLEAKHESDVRSRRIGGGCFFFVKEGNWRASRPREGRPFIPHGKRSLRASRPREGRPFIPHGKRSPIQCASPSGCRKDPMPGSSGGGVRTVPPGRPTPQQSMSGLDLEELAEIGTVCSLPAPSREEIGGFLSGALCPFLFFFLKDLFILSFGCAGSSLLLPGFLCLRQAGATPR